MQKRELLAHAVAAVVTTALIAAPLLTPPAGSVDVSSETALPAYSFAGAVTAVAVAEVTAPPLGVPLAARPRVRTGNRTEPAVPKETLASAAIERVEPRRPGGRKWTNWLTGSGSVAIRPFPAVPALRQ